MKLEGSSVEPRIIPFLGLLNPSVFFWLELVLQAGDDNYNLRKKGH
jgi:hypothetical protein